MSEKIPAPYFLFRDTLFFYKHKAFKHILAQMFQKIIIYEAYFPASEFSDIFSCSQLKQKMLI